METDAQKRSQRILFVGLRRMSNDRNLIIDGFRYWSTELANQPFDIETIVSSLVDYLGLDGNQKKKLMVSLHAASGRMTEDLPPVPAGLLDRIATPQQSAEFEQESHTDVRKSQQPHCVVTAGYLQALVRLLIKQDMSAFDDLKAILREEDIPGISDSMQSGIRDWASEGLMDLTLPDDVSEADCKHLAHEFYLFLTELIGPIDADDLVTAAIGIAKTLDEAARFQPRLLA